MRIAGIAAKINAFFDDWIIIGRAAECMEKVAIYVDVKVLYFRPARPN